MPVITCYFPPNNRYHAPRIAIAHYRDQPAFAGAIFDITKNITTMLFQNKWANLLFLVVLMVIVTLIIVKNTKVLDAAGKDTNNKLGFSAAA